MTTPLCVFCGQGADTQEHVVPKWLQRHFDLFDQRLLLSNGTTIPYRQAIVPACRRCNGDRLAPLEERIQANTASVSDYFLWALKITAGLSHRDASLPLDRTDPSAGTVVPPDSFAETAALLQHAVLGLDSPSFKFSPDPFGSVIFLPSTSHDFALIDVPKPYRAVAIALPNRGHLVVLPADRGVLASMYRQTGMLQSLEKVEALGNAQLQLALTIFSMLILRSHLAIPRGVRLEPGAMIADTVPERIPTITQDREVYRDIASKLHLPEDVADLAFGRYSTMYAAGALVRWR